MMYGKKTESGKVVSELLASLFNINDYEEIKFCWGHICVLLSHPFVTYEVKESLAGLIKSSCFKTSDLQVVAVLCRFQRN